VIYGKLVWNPYNVEKTVARTTFIAAIHGTDHPFIRVYVVLEAEGLALAISPPRVLDIPLAPFCFHPNVAAVMSDRTYHVARLGGA